ncbi:hypothetical protein X734_23350 [Mesorhizobium sp. L2C084A000]|nr:hypothetical protein X734_23350 [Mesorhizobium sp. L2C084A000]
MQQGDIIRRTPALERLLETVHPFYLNADYRYFMVLTQTCDLVSRDGAIATPYISLCAIRPLQEVINREAKKYQTNNVLKKANAITEQGQSRVRMFLKSLLNNNNHEYFYVHEQVNKGIGDRMCAFLRLSISLKTEHYAIVKKARILSLKPEFQAKLGWLVGNIYSRVGTDDWVPRALPENEWNELIENIVKENVVTLNDKKVESVKKNTPADVVDAWDTVTAREAVNGAQGRKLKDEVIEIVTTVLRDANIIPEDLMGKAVLNLQQSPELKAKVRN